jgi:hypothetical protein
MAKQQLGEDPNDETFWSTNPGFTNEGLVGRWSHLFSSDITFPFVQAKPLPGIRRWRVRWRMEPSPAGWIMSMFMSGSRATVERWCAAENARLDLAHRQRQKRKDDAEKAKRNADKKRARVERDERHVAGAQDGTHTSGHWWNCPACNPNKDRKRRERGED